MVGITQLLGRIMIALIFILAGVGKVMDPAGTAGYMESMGVSSMLLWPAAILEILGGVAIIIGYKTSWGAFALAVFSIAAAVLFHNDFGNKMQMILFMKNIALAGGLFLLAAGGPTGLSLDKKIQKKNFF